MLKKEYPMRSQTLYLLSKAVSKALIFGRIVVLRSRINNDAVKSTTSATIPVMRSDQASDKFSIIGVVAEEKMMPPTPEPAAAIPCARLLFLLNH